MNKLKDKFLTFWGKIFWTKIYEVNPQTKGINIPKYIPHYHTVKIRFANGFYGRGNLEQLLNNEDNK